MSEPRVHISILESDQARVLDRVASGVFDNEVNMVWTRQFLRDARHHLAVAIVTDQVIGMASAVHYLHADKPPELWINEVAVAEPFQGRRVGRRLVEALLERGRQVGCCAAWVLTTQANENAMRLFASCEGRRSSPDPVMFEWDLRH